MTGFDLLTNYVDDLEDLNCHRLLALENIEAHVDIP